MEGKKIGYLKGSTNDVYLRQWFKREKLEHLQIGELVNVPVENMPIMLAQGQVDAIAPWEPYSAQAVREPRRRRGDRQRRRGRPGGRHHRRGGARELDRQERRPDREILGSALPRRAKFTA